MAQYGTLIKTRMWNPYLCNGKQIKSIAFFDPRTAEVLCATHSGWLSIGGSNNDGCSALEEMQFRNRRKPFLNLSEPHQVNDTIYVPVTWLNGFTFEPDSFHSEHANGEKHYGNHVTFECGATSDYSQQFPHLCEVKPRRILIGCYTRVVKTGQSARVQLINEFLKDKQIEINTYPITRLLRLSLEERQEMAKLLTDEF